MLAEGFAFILCVSLAAGAFAAAAGFLFLGLARSIKGSDFADLVMPNKTISFDKMP